MIRKMYSIYDKRTKAYAAPFSAVTHDQALRMVHGAASDPSTELHQYPVDYALFYCGDFDDNDGRLESNVTCPEMLGSVQKILASFEIEENTK